MGSLRKVGAGIALSLAMAATEARALKPGQVCPVAVDNLELSYRHQGPQSTPQLSAMLGNRSGKRITSARFELSLLDISGAPHPYPEDMVLEKGLDVDKRKTQLWALSAQAVDIHRTGESLVLLEVTFDDQTGWKDDGSGSCGSAVDYHAR